MVAQGRHDFQQNEFGEDRPQNAGREYSCRYQTYRHQTYRGRECHVRVDHVLTTRLVNAPTRPDTLERVAPEELAENRQCRLLTKQELSNRLRLA